MKIWCDEKIISVLPTLSAAPRVLVLPSNGDIVSPIDGTGVRPAVRRFSGLVQHLMWPRILRFFCFALGYFVIRREKGSRKITPVPE